MLLLKNFAHPRGERLVKVQLPIGEKQNFSVIDLISMKAFMADGKTVTDIPGPIAGCGPRKAHGVLVEAARGKVKTPCSKNILEAGSLSDTS